MHTLGQINFKTGQEDINDILLPYINVNIYKKGAHQKDIMWMKPKSQTHTQ